MELLELYYIIVKNAVYSHIFKLDYIIVKNAVYNDILKIIHSVFLVGFYQPTLVDIVLPIQPVIH